MSSRPLGVAREIIEDIGSEVSYMYEDLVFVEHNAFIIQFDDVNTTNLKLLINVECEEDAAQVFFEHLTAAAKDRKFTIEKGGKYKLKPNDSEETFDIEFLP